MDDELKKELKPIIVPTILVLLVFGFALFVASHSDLYYETKASERQRAIEFLKEHTNAVPESMKQALMDDFNITEEDIAPVNPADLLKGNNETPD